MMHDISSSGNVGKFSQPLQSPVKKKTTDRIYNKMDSISSALRKYLKMKNENGNQVLFPQ